jgi:cardiolipin synthase
MTWLNAANALTLARLAAAPWLWFWIVTHRDLPALMLCLGAGLTDGLDGWVARRFRCVTRAGAYLDPIADKILLATVFLALGLAGAVGWWVVALIFARDLLIVGVAGVLYLRALLRDFPPSVWGKASTLFQISLALATLAERAWGWRPDASRWLTWGVVALTVWSGVDYALQAARRVRRRESALPAQDTVTPLSQD